MTKFNVTPETFENNTFCCIVSIIEDDQQFNPDFEFNVDCHPSMHEILVYSEDEAFDHDTKADFDTPAFKEAFIAALIAADIDPSKHDDLPQFTFEADVSESFAL